MNSDRRVSRDEGTLYLIEVRSMMTSFVKLDLLGGVPSIVWDL